MRAGAWPPEVVERARQLRRERLGPSAIAAQLADELGGRGPADATVSGWTAAIAKAAKAVPPQPVPLPVPPCPVLVVERLPGESDRAHAWRTVRARRLAIVQLQRWVLGHPERLRAVLLDPPEVLHGLTVLDVIMFGRARRSRSLEAIGRRAVRDRVNLLIQVGRASTGTRCWAAEHGTLHMRRRRVSS